MSHVLLKYIDDDVLEVKTFKSIIQNKQNSFLCKAKYCDGKYYEARILKRGSYSNMKHEKKQMSILDNTVNSIPTSDENYSPSNDSDGGLDDTLSASNDDEIIRYNLTKRVRKNLDKSFDRESDGNNNDQGDKNENSNNSLKDIESCSPGKRLGTVSPIGKVMRRSWSTPERQAARKHFGKHLKDFTLPSGPACSYVRNIEPVLSARTPVQIKAWVNNQIQLKKRKETRDSKEQAPKNVERIPIIILTDILKEKNYKEIEKQPTHLVLSTTKTNEGIISNNDDAANAKENARPDKVEKSDSCLKRYFCPYCKKSIVKFARHLTSMHTDVTEVKGILALPKQSSARKSIIKKIRAEGAYEFNTNASYNNGKLIVSRRPNKKFDRNPDFYIPCFNCKNYYSKTTIHRHVRQCHEMAKGRTIQQSGRAISRRIHSKANNIMIDQICPLLNPGLISDVIRYDELIILFGNKLTCKYRQAHLQYHIRQILRTMARFLITIKQLDTSIHDLKCVYHPKYYDLVLKTVNMLAKLNPHTNEYEIPSLATRLGNYIKKCGNLLAVEYIKQGNTENKKIVKDFLKLHAEDYGCYINKTAVETQTRLKRNTSIKIPLNEDIKKLHDFLQIETDKLTNKLKKHFSYQTWLRLSMCILTSVQLFNRKRAGEIERLEIHDFESYQTIDEEKHSDLYNSLSKLEQCLARRFVKVELRGKKGRTVPILLSTQQVANINLILSFREKAKVHKNNKYVFGGSGNSDKFIRACNALRLFAKECGAKHPELLRGTTLRKQIATTVQILNLRETELSQLANFMGHDISIHKEHYRLPSTALEIGQLSKLLLVMEEGNLNVHKGKNLQEISVLDEDLDTTDSVLQSTAKKCVKPSKKRKYIKSVNTSLKHFKQSESDYTESN